MYDVIIVQHVEILNSTAATVLISTAQRLLRVIQLTKLCSSRIKKNCFSLGIRIGNPELYFV